MCENYVRIQVDGTNDVLFRAAALANPTGLNRAMVTLSEKILSLVKQRLKLVFSWEFFCEEHGKHCDGRFVVKPNTYVSKTSNNAPMEAREVAEKVFEKILVDIRADFNEKTVPDLMELGAILLAALGGDPAAISAISLMLNLQPPGFADNMGMGNPFSLYGKLPSNSNYSNSGDENKEPEIDPHESPGDTSPEEFGLEQAWVEFFENHD